MKKIGIDLRLQLKRVLHKKQLTERIRECKRDMNINKKNKTGR